MRLTNHIETRLRELQALEQGTNLDSVERVALYTLHTFAPSVILLDQVTLIGADRPDRWVLWVCECLVFCARSLRKKQHREALRGWGQVREYIGRNGGFLPAPLSDHAVTIQNALEELIAPR
jgi:hypothetical protein